jgi:hypothetical protein
VPISGAKGRNIVRDPEPGSPDLKGQPRDGRRKARTETSEAFRTWVIGVHDRIMIVAAPVRSDGALVAVIAGQVWLCRTFQATSAFRFRGTVLRVAFEPFPHVHVEVPEWQVLSAASTDVGS